MAEVLYVAHESVSSTMCNQLHDSLVVTSIATILYLKCPQSDIEQSEDRSTCGLLNKNIPFENGKHLTTAKSLQLAMILI